MSGFLENILGQPEPETTVQTELETDAAELDHYRPYLTKPRAQLALILIEKDGTMHGFQYHAIKHTKYEVRDGLEFLSFNADGCAAVFQGKSLRVLFYAMQRYALAEVREDDGKRRMEGQQTVIDRLAVQEPQERQRPPQQAPRLVK